MRRKAITTVIRTGLGLVLWIGILCAPWGGLFSSARPGAETRSTRAAAPAVFRYLLQRNRYVDVECPSVVELAVGATVRLAEPALPAIEGPLQPPAPAENTQPSTTETAPPGSVIGEVSALLDDDGQPRPDLFGRARRLRLRLYDRARVPLFEDASLRVVLVPQTFDWVLHTLLTDKATQEIAAEWNRTLLRHREEFFDLLTPVVRGLLTETERHVARELPGFRRRHRDNLRALARRLEADLGGPPLADLFQTQIWPLAEPRLRPITERIGSQILKKLPLWGLTWRLAYEKLPFTEDDHFRERWDNFVEREVQPILNKESPALVEALREIGRDSFANPKVSAHLRGAVERLLESPEFERLAHSFVKEMFLDNPSFHALLRQHWEAPGTQTAVQRAAQYLEPMLRRMGDVVLGTRATGISDEFAQVLRSQILLKDRQKLLLHPGTRDPGAAGSGELPDGAVLPATVEWETKE